MRLEQKAAETGTLVIKVDARYTSQDCSNPDCEYRFTDLTLSQRWVTCPDCGLSLDRDHNAALNVLQRTVQVLEA
jgi:putative transposase